MDAICYTEHGNIYSYIEKCLYAQSKGLKYLHGVECYLTETLDEKIRDNYHTILIAKNKDGVCELNELIDVSTSESHFYYKPRITFDEFLGISENIIKISACLASPLNKIRHNNRLEKAYDYYEIQPHINSEEQIEYNKYLWELSKKNGIPLIAGTDTHSLDKYKAECRSILQRAKNIQFATEDKFDLTWKTYDELVEMFRLQNALPDQVYLEAINNTNVMAASVEDFVVDTSFKYPVVEDSKQKLYNLSIERYKEKVANGIIKEDKRYLDNIDEEIRVFDKVGMCGFMYMMSDILTWCKENNIPNSPCRGSVGGSTVAFLTDITEVDPLVWNTVFSRFCNESRIEIGDIDIDVPPDQRDKVYEYIINKFGDRNCSFILASGTLCDRATIDEICRAIGVTIPETKKIKDLYESNPIEARNKYPHIFYYFDGLNGCVVSQSMHPAGIVVSPVDLVSNYGTFWKDNKRIISINMEEIHDISLVKYDILSLANLTILRQCCELAGIKYPKVSEINWKDQDVFNDITCSPVGIFQFESPFAFDSLRKFKAKSVEDISLVTAAIRPSGESYRNRLLARESNKNPSEEIDELLKENNGFLIYQEDVIAFLQKICGLSGSDADNVRRAIGRKDAERLEAALPEIFEGYCSNSKKERCEAEQEARAFLKIIEDSSSYMFGRNHSIGYSMVSYLCAYMRYYHPVEFITAYLNNCNKDEDIAKGMELARIKKIKVMPIKFGKSRSNYYIYDDKTIYKGISSIKYIGKRAAEELFLAGSKEKFESFSDVLLALKNTSINSRQIEILVDLDFFSEYGNSQELHSIIGVFDKLKQGDAKELKKESIMHGSTFEDVVAKYSDGKTKNGQESKSWKILDYKSIMYEMEKEIKNLNLPDYDLDLKIKFQLEYLGHIAITGVDSDRTKLVATDVFDIKRRSDGKQFGKSVTFQSIGSGKTTRFSIMNKVWASCGEIKKGDIVQCISYKKDGQYYQMTNYKIICKGVI